jgi:hypothetical protein
MAEQKFDITAEHPAYEAFECAWELMRDAFDGEDAIKTKKEKYLPMKSGTAAIKNSAVKEQSYKAYRDRAEFPELVAPTVRGAVGVMLKRPAVIELPASMEYLREKATLDGLPLEELHRRIAVELMLMGRYGLLPGMTAAGNAYIAGYVTESIKNWDNDADGTLNYLVLDECAPQRDRATNKWSEVEKYRECYLNDAGQYVSREWAKNAKGEWQPGEETPATVPGQKPLTILPFTFIGTTDLTDKPDDVPLYGLGKLSVRIYRMDADYVFALHMTAEPTPVVTGYSDPEGALANGTAPASIGSSTIWILPQGGDAKFLEFTGAGISAQQKAIGDALNRAVAYGAQILTDTQRTAESGDAIRLRLGNQTSLLHLIALTSARGLEKALRDIAVWLGEDPNQVTVTPNLEFFDEPLTSNDLNALVAGWQSGAYSYETMFDRFKRGGLVPADRTADEEQEKMAAEPLPEMVAPVTASTQASASQTSQLGVPDGP